jgi:hypothetical protein
MTKLTHIILTGAVLTIGTFGTLAAIPASATQCADGSFSTSTGSGTCSWHGGIAGNEPSYNSGGGSGGSSGNSGIYYTPASEPENPNDNRNLNIIAAAGFGFWIWVYSKFR